METLADKVASFGSLENIPYSELLKTQEWQKRRMEIIRRDDYMCTKCGEKRTTKLWDGHYNIEIDDCWEYTFDGETFKIETEPQFIFTEKDNPIYLHVHHLYYSKGYLPWEYPDSALVTLCEAHHRELHSDKAL
ncbi:MAG TPA: hypothetical protein VK154_06885 [Chitinophagales bacterium]|nr:hypothetical protein [Chitinophagales bacterium]